MLSNMAASLILHKRITTTLAKAKELRKYVEPLITRGKEDTTHSRRVVFSYLQNKFAVSELFREISQKVGDRPGGYTRILKTGFRKGDNAEMCIIELVDYNETYTVGEEKKKTTKTRRGRGKAKTEEQKGNKAEEQKSRTSATSAALSTSTLSYQKVEESDALKPDFQEEPFVAEEQEVLPSVETDGAEEQDAEVPQVVEEAPVGETAVEETSVEEEKKDS
jgi:large subunit ribosomal protein L17